MTKLTTKSIDKALADAGIRLAVQKANGYCYFYVPAEFERAWCALYEGNESASTTRAMPTPVLTVSVCVPTLNALTLEQWLDDAKAAQKEIWPQFSTIELIDSLADFCELTVANRALFASLYRAIRAFKQWGNSEFGLVASDAHAFASQKIMEKHGYQIEKKIHARLQIAANLNDTSNNF